MTPLLSIDDLTVEYAVGGKTLFGRVGRQPRRSAAARRWGWWANRAAASPRWAAPCCSCAGRPAAA